MDNLTVQETINKMFESLRDYIEATYHIENEQLIRQRRKLLEKPGVIYQLPYIESTPKYKSGKKISDLKVNSTFLELLLNLSDKKGDLKKQIHDPLWEHQAKSIEDTLIGNKSLLVMTGTGSGKTEAFLLPILGKLINEASKESFKLNAVRAIILYPMNALVNDQLGRLRKLFGDSRIINKFIELSNRPVRFARYTSRTPYPGLRTKEKDQLYLKSIGAYYLPLINEAASENEGKKSRARVKIEQLKEKGKWPSKPDILKWYGNDRDRWQDKNGEFKRCILQERDSELITRHEVLNNPPDVLITNYSMLEYMLMRPLENPIFEKTKKWLKESSENLMLVVDEAHLYKGAGGTEVAYLLRRLINRLDIKQDRLQVICTSASFSNPKIAKIFTSDLTGKDINDIKIIEGSLDFKEEAKIGTEDDVNILSSINMDGFYNEIDNKKKLELVNDFLKYRRTNSSNNIYKDLYIALKDYPPLNLIINKTMKKAVSFKDLVLLIFPGDISVNKQEALTNLLALGSIARYDDDSAPLLPCRIHSLYRGLPGLWICLNKDCCELSSDEKGGPTGKLYNEPINRCKCGGLIYELFTCRNCGSAYARAYTNDLESPKYLWNIEGKEIISDSEIIKNMFHIDILLNDPVRKDISEMISLNLNTGEINEDIEGSNVRKVYIKKYDEGKKGNNVREFRPCAVCGESGWLKSNIQDHQTSGSEPYLSIISQQINIQPPSNKILNSKFSPLKGRKLLIFSDSRQIAAQLAPDLQLLSMKDAIRPLLIYGYRLFENTDILKEDINLNYVYLAIVTAAFKLNVPLRPKLESFENFQTKDDVEKLLKQGNIRSIYKLLPGSIPNSLCKITYDLLFKNYYNLESLGLASIIESRDKRNIIEELPDIPHLNDIFISKISLVRFWLTYFFNKCYAIFDNNPPDYKDSIYIKHKGYFSKLDSLFIKNKEIKKIFTNKWLPVLLDNFTMGSDNGNYLRANSLTLDLSDEWAYCTKCKRVQRVLLNNMKCMYCLEPYANKINVYEDKVFLARKYYYRKATLDVLKENPEPPFSLICQEHSAQLNSTNKNELLSLTEKYEMLFQDIEVEDENKEQAIDVLSCTTTMEVGIDIGSLSGVSLRNMPPTRSNYQQRSGRAGRRGNAIATVTAYASSDSHDNYNFSNPKNLISGEVIDPILNLDNPDILNRHILSFLLQEYHREKLLNQNENIGARLFDVLGTVSEFLNNESILNKDDFFNWLDKNISNLRTKLNYWIPDTINNETKETILRSFVTQSKDMMNYALDELIINNDHNVDNKNTDKVDIENNEYFSNSGVSKMLLEWLLYKGVLPKYAFPTDVVSFYIFDTDYYNKFNKKFTLSPQTGLSLALSQYAPGKVLTINNKKYISSALYSPIFEDLVKMWEDRKMYISCNKCGFSKTLEKNEINKGEFRKCDACGSDSCGPAMTWMKPPGFAHAIEIKENNIDLNPDNISYATRAKLIAPSPTDWNKENKITDNLYSHFKRDRLLVTNAGPKDKGYNYCLKCGKIEPYYTKESIINNNHKTPYPSDEDCTGNPVKKITLGTDFITDIFLILFRVNSPVVLNPCDTSTHIVMRTISDSLVKAATSILDLDHGEIQAEYRPALTPYGPQGKEVEIYLYDTLTGGAGYSKAISKYGLNLLTKALNLLEDCDCDRSCYKCLRSYKNKLDHWLLDRHLGINLLRYLLKNEIPTTEHNIKMNYQKILQEDLKRIEPNFRFIINKEIKIENNNVIAPIYIEHNGIKYIIDLINPLTPSLYSNPLFKELIENTLGEYEIIKCNEMVINYNLPRATHNIITQITH